MQRIKSIKNAKNLRGKIVFVRVDFNVPIKNGVVLDDFRIRKALPLISFLKKSGAKIIVASHLGKGKESMLPIFSVFKKFFNAKLASGVCDHKTLQEARGLRNGEILMLENLRKEKGEQAGDKKFASLLASMAQIFVNEAFSVSHRKDASLYILPKLLPAYAGLQLLEEIKNLSSVFQKPKHPFLFILGGAKFSTKIPLIKKYLRLADYVFVGGALANNFLKARGFEVGKSLIDENVKGIEKILKNKRIILPSDFYVLNKFPTSSAIAENIGMRLKKIGEVQKNEIILDMGDESVRNLGRIIKKSKLILWNGPLGKYEDGGDGSTKKILKLVASSQAKSVIGGGDTVEVLSKLKMEKDFSFISTGGGATLDFLVNGTLPGIKALE